MGNKELVAQAVAGDLAPLIAELKSKSIPMSGKATHNVTQDMEPPDNDLWFKVMAAYMDDEFNDAQFSELHAACVEGHKLLK